MKTYSHLEKLPGGQASDRVTEGCVLLEGGAFRGVFSSGVTDELMLEDLNFSTAIGVSAGALNAYNYIAGAIGRSARVNLIYRHDPRWVGRKALRGNRGIMGFNFLYGELARRFPVDREKMMASDRRLIAVTTNCLDGRTQYFEKDCGSIEQAIRASASMPVVSAMVYIDGVPYLDGGCSNRLPVSWALEQGFEKIVVVRTRPRGFRREEKPVGKVQRALYRKYPGFLAALEQSSAVYNEECDRLDRLEREGRVFAIYPSGAITVSRLEGDMEKLGQLYFEGIKAVKSRLGELREYLA